MSLSNYPDGVTGNEPEIAGCGEGEGEQTCPQCGIVAEIEYGIWNGELFWDCDGCGNPVSVEAVDPRE